MVPAGNKAKRLSSVSHTTKTIQFNFEHVFTGWVTSLTEIMRDLWLHWTISGILKAFS